MMKQVSIFILSILTVAGTFAQSAPDYSLVPFRVADKWGYATPEKQVVIEPKYAEAGWFSEGMAAVKIGNKYGYINRTGKLVIPARYTVAKPFRKGYRPHKGKEGGDSVLFAGASITANGYEICIDQKGKRMPQCPAINENSAVENKEPLTQIVQEKTYSLPGNKDLFDKIVDDYKMPDQQETYYIAVKDNRYGVFNSKFETIVPFEYSSIRMNRNKNMPFLEVNKAGMFGVIMADGKVSIEPVYSNLKAVEGLDGTEYIIIRKDGKNYVKDINNRDIISTGFADITYDNGGFVITSDEQLKGYYFTDNHVIQPKYKEINWPNGSPYLRVKTKDGRQGYISTTGEEYFRD